jgi:hypothetical protein
MAILDGEKRPLAAELWLKFLSLSHHQPYFLPSSLMNKKYSPTSTTNTTNSIGKK